MKTDSEIERFWQELALKGEHAGHPVRLLEQTVSTNSDAMAAGKSGAPAGTVFLARSQSGGRGRLGKSWLSPAGSGLYFSMILRPEIVLADLPKITLAAGLALCRSMSGVCTDLPMIKWPNDLFFKGRKCGGILTETHIEGAQPLVVLGVGLNISTPLSAFPADLQKKATSLMYHYKGEVDYSDLLGSIFSHIDKVMKEMEEGRFTEIIQEWRLFDATKGKRLSWLTTDHKVITGVSLGPDDEGLLHIRDDLGMTHQVLSGDIQLQSP